MRIIRQYKLEHGRNFIACDAYSSILDAQILGFNLVLWIEQNEELSIDKTCNLEFYVAYTDEVFEKDLEYYKTFQNEQGLVIHLYGCLK